MIIIHNPEPLPPSFTGTVLTIGNFDGVHLGHKTLLTQTANRARELALPSLAVTFEPHPQRFFQRGAYVPALTTFTRKAELVAECKIDCLYILPFDRDMANLQPEEFVKSYLVDKLRVKALVIGYNYALGKGRRGNWELLGQLGAEFGFTVQQIDPFLKNGAIVSSTRIRDLIAKGEVFEASRLLGHFHMVGGTVVHGFGRGSTLLGFPTANLKYDDVLLPRPGVYAAKARLLPPQNPTDYICAEYNLGAPGASLPTPDSCAFSASILPAVLNIGYNPTFAGRELTLEAHLLDFKADIYGRRLEVYFVQRLRDEVRFSHADELKQRITRDADLARQILA